MLSLTSSFTDSRNPQSSKPFRFRPLRSTAAALPSLLQPFARALLSYLLHSQGLLSICLQDHWAAYDKSLEALVENAASDTPTSILGNRSGPKLSLVFEAQQNLPDLTTEGSKSNSQNISIFNKTVVCLRFFKAMSSESQDPSALSSPAAQEDESKSISKKAAKKEAAKLEKLRRRQDASLVAAASSLSVDEDTHSQNYGNIPLLELQSKTIADIGDWAKVEALTNSLENRSVLIRGRAQTIRAVGKKMAFLVLRENGFTVQCVVQVQPGLVSPQMVKFATALSRESIVDIEGVVSVPGTTIKGATQQVEVQVRKLYCVSRAVPTLPINIEDAARSEIEIEKALQAGEQLVRVNQDTRLNFRVLDLRTPANQGIFRIQSQVGNVFRQFLLSESFFEIHTPKLIAGSSEGGAAVFKLDYKGHSACLAQSPQLHKQMSICGDFGRVFEIGAVFRAEDSYTHRHLCEFTGLDVEMEIKKHYSEVMDIVDRLFVAMFDSLNQNCKKDLEAVGRQYPFEPLKYLRQTLRLTYEEGVQMLKDAGVEIEPFGDLNTEAERKLGQLVLQKYGTEFYILHRYPLAVRPFYTMPCYDNPEYSNSFDVFIRGEEIISGAQRVHVPEFLEERAVAKGIDVKTISTYIDSFRYGAPPHGGFGVGLERVVMLFCGLNNIRKTSLYPRDPLRIAP